ncbi:hypothetical protein FRC11_011817 [Ceratobasidium sp. 423]|nr:hypothetical protein FRC11_011817 [Ceratobasidium sp. 423]
MPPQTRSKLQIQLLPMPSLSLSNGDNYDEQSYMCRQKESGDWDERYGAPIRPPVTKRKCVSVSVQTSPIEEVCPPLCRDNGSSSGSSPDPESEGEEGYANKHGLKRSGSTTSSQAPKKAKVAKLTASPTKAAPPKQPRRDTIITLVDGTTPKPRSIYAPSPTPLQCTYIYPVALGPPRRPVDLRRNKGAKPLPLPEAPLLPQAAPQPPANPNAPAPAGGACPPAGGAPMEIDDSHSITHRCPITFSREFEMRRHIRTVHIAEEVRAVVEGRLPRSQAVVIPESWDGKTLISKPTCAGCGTTFSRPDAVRRHQTEVNAKMENGICIECPGPKVHIRRGPRKDIHLPTPDSTPSPPTLASAPVPALMHVMSAGTGAGAPVPIAPAPAPASSIPAVAPTPAPALAPAPIPGLVPIAPAAPVAAIPSLPAPAPAPLAPGAGVTSDAAPAPAALPVAPQPSSAARDHVEPAEVELESEDECN